MTTDYDALASHLTRAKMGTGSIPPSIQELPKFLSTSSGRQAVRAAIDSMIARQKLMGIQPQAAHTEIISSLMGQMPGAQNAAAPSSSPMQTMQTPDSQMGNMAQGSDPTQIMGQTSPMQGMPNQQGGY